MPVFSRILGPMPEQIPRAERLKSLSADELTELWYALPEGESRFFMVTRKPGEDPFREGTKGRTSGEYDVLKISAEPTYADDDLELARPTGAKQYLAAEMKIGFNGTDDTITVYTDADYYAQRLADKVRHFLPIDDVPASDPISAEPKPAEGSSESDLRPTSEASTPEQLSGAERIKRETNESTQSLLRATSELLNPELVRDDPEKFKNARHFVRTIRDRFEKLGIDVERVGLLGESGTETSVDRYGVALSRSIESRRGENVAGGLENPEDTVPTLVITVWHRTHEMASDQFAPNMDEIGRLINTIATLRSAIEGVSTKDVSELRVLLESSGISQVRLDAGLHRSRLGYKYTLRIPLVGASVEKK